MLIIMAGLPGTGKSTLARQLALALPALILDKDPIRAALFPPERIEYATPQDDFCMGVMLQVAEYLLRQDPATHVILDGRTFSRRYQVETVADLATCLHQPLRIIECVCSDAAAQQRLARDAAQGSHVAGNRNFALYQAIKARFESIERPKLSVNTDEELNATIAQCLQFLRTDR